MTLAPIKYEDVKKGYHFWAKKGDVWNNTRHLTKSGAAGTLCGTPMLGNNYSQSSEGSGREVGCQACLAKYQESSQ
jgi:hypothetical protein